MWLWVGLGIRAGVRVGVLVVFRVGVGVGDAARVGDVASSTFMSLACLLSLLCLRVESATVPWALPPWDPGRYVTQPLHICPPSSPL